MQIIKTPHAAFFIMYESFDVNRTVNSDKKDNINIAINLNGSNTADLMLLQSSSTVQTSAAIIIPSNIYIYVCNT